MQVIKVPGINGFGKTKGCERAGNEIIDCLKNIHSSEDGRPIDTKILDLEEIHLDNDNFALTNKLIYKNSLEAFETKPKLVFLGGDHSISFSLTRAFFDYCKNMGRPPCLIVFDSHPDMMPFDLEYPPNEGWLRALIKNGFPAKNILLVGLRNSHPNEIKFLKETGVRTLSLNEVAVDIENACDTIMEFANGKELYLSLDMNSVDPAYAPSTNNREPGGLTSRQLIYLIQRINKMKNLKAVDIVEINSDKDKEFDNLTVRLGAKVLSEFI